MLQLFTELNILVPVKYPPVVVLEIIDCQVHLPDSEKNTESLYVIDFLRTLKNDPNQKITDVVMFDGDLNVQLGGKLMKTHDPKLTVMRGVEHIVSLFIIFFPIYQ